MKDFWNCRYAEQEYAYGKEPNQFLLECFSRFNFSGNILFPAEGEGRNAVYAARHGLKVHAFDISEEGKKKAENLAAESGVCIEYVVADFEQFLKNDFKFDTIVLIYNHLPSKMMEKYASRLVEMLQPNGRIILEGFSENNLPLREKNPSVGGPVDADMLYTLKKVEHFFRDLKTMYLQEEIVELNEGNYHNGLASVIRYIGVKN
ncbi:MAG: class I SAM-dependent methyltransferase [Flavobacteriales bacterium]|nr:class I SAM-dependent methyltransferase [Flavobacteriales bacterium]